MHPFVSPALELKKRSASNVMPGWLIGLLAALQVILWLLIMILEGISVYYDATHGTIYAGFWCSGIFFITWVSMFSFLCCGKANCCGICLIVMNTIALCFSIILVTFTNIFINDPCDCYVLYCEKFSWITCIPVLIQRKVPYLKGLLACGVLMLLSNLVYIITYIAISIWLSIRGNADMDKMNATYQNQSAYINPGLQQQYPPTFINYPSQIGQQQQQHPPYPMSYPSQIGQQQQHPPYPMNYPSQIGQQQYPPYPMNYPSQVSERPYSVQVSNDGQCQPSPSKTPTSQQQASQNDGVVQEQL